MDNLRLKKLALKFIKKSIDWSKTSNNISREIKWRFGYRQVFSFLFGFKISINECIQIDKIKSVEFDDIKPGTITSLHNDGTFDVKTGNGLVRITDYTIHVPDLEIKKIRDFLEKVQISDTPVLTKIPFSNNEEANRWEAKYQRFTIGNLDQLGKQLDLQKLIISDTTTGNVSQTTVKDLVGTEGELVKKNLDFIEYLVAKLGLKKDSRILDMGCGSGWVCHMFAKYGLDVYGCDLSPYCISVAKNIVPSAKFFVQDIFDLPNQDNLKGKFDLIFCRDLGIAQKIVDWTDPKWVSVGMALAEMLTENGVVYWIQMSDLSGKIMEDGFSNTPIDTLVEYFSKIGHLINVNVYGFESFMFTKKNPSENFLHHISQFNNKVNSQIYSNWISSKDEVSAKNLAKLIYSQVSQIFLLDPKKRKQGVAIIGNNTLSKVYSKICKELGLAYGIIDDDNLSYEDLVKHVQNSKQSIIIFTEQNHCKFLTREMTKSFDYIIEPFEKLDEISKQYVYLVSGDEDARFDEIKLSKVIPLLC